MFLRKKKRRIGVRKALAVLMALALFVPLVWMPAAAEAAVEDGVYSFGGGGYGQLGHGDTSGKAAPTRIAGLEDVRSVAAGERHSLVLLYNGDVYAFGESRYGQLGLGDNERKPVPTKIGGIGQAKDVIAGRYCSFILLENGDLYGFGSNWAGQLGVGDQEDKLTPTRVVGLSNVQKVAAGETHTLALLENGDVYAFGGRSGGVLGLGYDTPQYVTTPTKIPFPDKARDVAANMQHSLVVLENGDVYSFGHSGYGKLGILDPPGRTTFDTPQKIEQIGSALAVATGVLHSMVLLENGNLYTFGRNDFGELGLGDTEDRSFPTRVEALSGVSLIVDASYGNHSLALLESGELYSFGRGDWGQLGHGDNEHKYTPTRVEAFQGSNVLSLAAGGSHSLVVVGTPPITIKIDGQLLKTDVPPVIIAGRTMVPLRAIFEALDTDVQYIAETRSIIGTKGDTRIELTVDSTQAKVDGTEVALDVPATVMEGRTLVPVRFIAESTGQEVDWHARTRTVIINTIEPGTDFIEPGTDF